ncbi:MAG: gluconate 2-dehydrogenase subunit 3 family protein [Flavobacteriaceae bacterium]|nr:gluconate 2-dehydrogenase subunit 3 family protein [Flavobacteriaceae bacterium]
MDRRKALKNIGNGIGAIAVTPAVISLFQSCQTSATYNPLFIPKDDFKIISNLMEMIIPKTDIPGAIELKLPEFVDAYIDAVWGEKEKTDFTETWEVFIGASTKAAGKENENDLSAADWDAQLAKYLKPGNDIPADEILASQFVNQLRSLTVNAFKTNEFIGEEVLAYAPIPGEQKGCVDLMEATGGKAWSL